jgi:uncharacterized membrane protein
MTTAPPPSPGRAEERDLPPRLRGWVSRLLRGGLAIALVLVAVGAAGFVLQGAALVPSAGAVGLARAATASGWATDPSLWVYLGTAVLLVTPLVRVAVSLGLFAAAGDRAFTLLTLFVLAILGATVVVGGFA